MHESELQARAGSCNSVLKPFGMEVVRRPADASGERASCWASAEGWISALLLNLMDANKQRCLLKHGAKALGKDW